MQTITKYWFLEEFNLFRKIGMSNLKKISKLLEMETINKGASVALSDNHKDSIFFLKNGSIKIIDAHLKTVKYVVKPGNIFGELALFHSDDSKEEVAIALEDSLICYIKADQMEALMEEHKSLKNEVLKLYGIRIKKLERRLNDLLYKDSATRIKEFIEDYVKEFGHEKEDGTFVAKSLLSHKEIAHLTNTSRQTVNNVMSNLRKKGSLDYNSRFITIENKNVQNI